MKALIVRHPANDLNDMGMQDHLINALDVESVTTIPGHGNPKDILAPYDASGDFLVAMIYAGYEFKKEWMPSASKIIVYNQHDYQMKTDARIKAVEQIHDKDMKSTIIAPYGLRKSFSRMTERIECFYESTNDVAVMGVEARKMAFSSITRGSYLDDFQRAIRGRFHFFRYRCPHALTMMDYAQIMMQSKIALVTHGCSEHTFRFFEAMHLGVCIVSQKFRREEMWRDPGEVVPTFTTPEEGADICAELISSGSWREYRTKQRDWYFANHNEKVYDKWGKDVAFKLTGKKYLKCPMTY